MTGTVAGLRVLLGDALIAAGIAVRGDVADTFDGQYGRMECEGPDAADTYIPAEFRIPPAWAPIPLTDVRAALDELPDSSLLSIAATIIAGWKPILLKTTGDHTDVDVLIDVLHDRATQFRAVERDANTPLLTVDHLIDHVDPIRSPRRGQ